MPLTYRGAGVDVAGIRRSHARMGRIAAGTHGGGVARGPGHYAGLTDMGGGMLLATHTDGVGTKVMVANRLGRYDTVGIDCVAMNVNDIACVGARPASFVDYIAASRNDPGIFSQIMRGLARGARAAGVPIVGGETAVMPGLFGGRGFSFDLAGAVTGLVRRKDAVLGDRIRPGHAIVGARSTGLHSNGYSLARAALRGVPLGRRMEGGGTLGDALLEPTAVYSGAALEAARRCEVSGLAHITGGSFTKLPRLGAARYEIDSLPGAPPVMRLIASRGVGEAEMYRTFNMGVGFCVIAPEGEEGRISRAFARHGIEAARIGTVRRGRGVYVNSLRIA